MSMLKSVFVCLLLLVTTFGYSDGCYKSMEEVLPEITGQQAIIKHKDGVQTMIIESSLDSKAQELGWIVPLPSEPTEVKRVDSNIFAEMNRDMPLKMGKDSDIFMKVIGMFFLILILSVALSDTIGALTRVLLLGFLCFILFVISVPSLASARSIVGSSVLVIKDEIVGDYQIKVIKAVDSKALDSWLKENLFSTLSNDEKLVVDGYIKKGWCFSATKLIRKEAGKSTPHPLSFTFPSEKIIYPMALTALAGGEPFFGFFVISDQMVRHPQLDVYLAKKYRSSFLNKEYGIKNYHSSEGTTWGLNSFLAGDLFWNGMVVTRLGANIDSGDMEDLVFVKEPYQLTRNKVFSKDTAIAYSAGKALVVVNYMLLVLIFIALALRSLLERMAVKYGRILLFCFGIGISVGILIYSNLTMIDLGDQKFKKEHRFGEEYRKAVNRLWLLRIFSSENKSLFSSKEELMKEYKIFSVNSAKGEEYYDGKLFNEFLDISGYDIVEYDEMIHIRLPDPKHEKYHYFEFEKK